MQECFWESPSPSGHEEVSSCFKSEEQMSPASLFRVLTGEPGLGSPELGRGRLDSVYLWHCFWETKTRLPKSIPINGSQCLRVIEGEIKPSSAARRPEVTRSSDIYQLHDHGCHLTSADLLYSGETPLPSPQFVIHVSLGCHPDPIR